MPDGENNTVSKIILIAGDFPTSARFTDVRKPSNPGFAEAKNF